MNTNSPSRNRGGILKFFLLLMMIGLVFVVSVGAMIYASVRPGNDFRAVQNIVLDELPQKPNIRVSVRAPELLVSLARFGLSFVDDIDDEARQAIRAVHGGQVGVFQLPNPVPRAGKLQIMKRVDESMSQNEWTRVAAVVDRDQMVLVYAPEDLNNPGVVEVLTLVLNNNELVIVSVKGDLRPIYEIARSHLDEVSDELHRDFN